MSLPAGCAQQIRGQYLRKLLRRWFWGFVFTPQGWHIALTVMKYGTKELIRGGLWDLKIWKFYPISEYKWPRWV